MLILFVENLFYVFFVKIEEFDNKNLKLFLMSVVYQLFIYIWDKNSKLEYIKKTSSDFEVSL